MILSTQPTARPRPWAPVQCASCEGATRYDFPTANVSRSRTLSLTPRGIGRMPAPREGSAKTCSVVPGFDNGCVVPAGGDRHHLAAVRQRVDQRRGAGAGRQPRVFHSSRPSAVANARRYGSTVAPMKRTPPDETAGPPRLGEPVDAGTVGARQADQLRARRRGRCATRSRRCRRGPRPARPTAATGTGRPSALRKNSRDIA